MTMHNLIARHVKMLQELNLARANQHINRGYYMGMLAWCQATNDHAEAERYRSEIEQTEQATRELDEKIGYHYQEINRVGSDDQDLIKGVLAVLRSRS